MAPCKSAIASVDGADRRFLAGFTRMVDAGVCLVTLLCYHVSPSSNRSGTTSTTPDEKVSAIMKGHAATYLLVLVHTRNCLQI